MASKSRSRSYPYKRYCSVYGCANKRKNKEAELTFFKIPNDIERRQEWLTAIDREDLLDEKLKKAKNNFVCSAHFDDSAIIISILKRLKSDAAPTKLLPDKSQKNIPPDARDVSKQNAQPLPGPSKIPTTQTSDTNLSSKDQDPLRRGTIEQCRFCGEFTKCVSVSNKPYISNITTLAFNDITVQLDFNDETLPKTVCQACDAKLREMHDFVKVVNTAQESMMTVVEPRQGDIEIDSREDYGTLVVKTEYDDDDEGKDEDDCDDIESKEGIVDSLTIGETIYIKEAVTQKRKIKTKTASPKKPKKAKVTEVKSENEHELIIDIKEEVIERDTNDLECDTGCFVSDTGCSVSDTGTDAKPSAEELATSALVFEMRSDGSGYGYNF
ncbi:uncharacterized protein LOC134752946 [Cydia strobilella]|uniref:uncharacterized protein LOC134752946 n=1 Tax=Cydia strobilella TaxID=1100964 RepID=UPI0030050CEB